jgi:hypothetical protein
MGTRAFIVGGGLGGKFEIRNPKSEFLAFHPYRHPGDGAAEAVASLLEGQGDETVRHHLDIDLK